MAKNKETVPEILDEEIREEEQPSVKGPLRDDPEPAYTPAWQVVNRRQDVYSDKFPPKIHSLEALMAAGFVTEEMLEDGGYVKNTDYATSSKAGVIKTGGGYGAYTTGAGIIACSARTAQQYATDGTSMFIAKGTLENVKQVLVESALSLFCDATSSSAAIGTKLSNLTMTKTENGWVISFDTLTPPVP